MRFDNGTYGSLVLSQVSGGHKNDLRLSLDCQNYALDWQQEDADKLHISSRRDGNQLLFASPGTVSKEISRYAPLVLKRSSNAHFTSQKGVYFHVCFSI